MSNNISIAQQVMAMELDAQIFAAFYCLFGGPKNLLNRMLSYLDLQELLQRTVFRFHDLLNYAFQMGMSQQAVFYKVTGFVRKGLYTPNLAIVFQHFRNDYAVLVLHLKLEHGNGTEQRSRQLPYSCQHQILEAAEKMTEHDAFYYLEANDPEALGKYDILSPEELEVSSTRIGQLFPMGNLWSQFMLLLRQKLFVANDARNAVAHRELRDTNAIREALTTMIELMKDLGGNPRHRKRLRRICEELTRWDAHTAYNKQLSIHELQDIFKQLIRQYETNELFTFDTFTMDELLEAAKERWASKVIAKWGLDLKSLGKKFLKWIKDVLKGSRRPFVYPKRIPLSTAGLILDDGGSEVIEEEEEVGEDEVNPNVLPNKMVKEKQKGKGEREKSKKPNEDLDVEAAPESMIENAAEEKNSLKRGPEEISEGGISYPEQATRKATISAFHARQMGLAFSSSKGMVIQD